MDLRLNAGGPLINARVLVCCHDLMAQLGGGQVPAPLFPPSPPSQPLTIHLLRRCQCIGGLPLGRLDGLKADAVATVSGICRPGMRGAWHVDTLYVLCILHGTALDRSKMVMHAGSFLGFWKSLELQAFVITVPFQAGARSRRLLAFVSQSVSMQFE
jgi:hypothetical protein